METQTMTGDVEKLPKWAQQHIARLQRELEHAEQSLADYLARGDFVRGTYGEVRVPHRVTLHSSASPISWGALRATFSQDHVLEVSTTGRLVIETSASNVVKISNKDAAE